MPGPAPATIPSQTIKPSHVKRNIIVLGILVLLIGIAASSIMRAPEIATPGSQTTVQSEIGPAGPQIVILDYNVAVTHVGLDSFELGAVLLSLKNEGDVAASISQLVVTSDNHNITADTYTTLGAGESGEVTYNFWSYQELPKKIGADKIEITMKVVGHPETTSTETFETSVLAEKAVAIPIQKLRVGDTVQEIHAIQELHNLSLTLLWWKESKIAVNGQYTGIEYYTFSAKPGMKFVILAFKFQNNWIRTQETPYIDSGEIGTDKGYIYSVWVPPEGIHSTEYNPRLATSQELKDLVGDAGAYEHLLQGQSVDARVVFEIPQDATPIEATLVYLPPTAIVAYGGATTQTNSTQTSATQQTFAYTRIRLSENSQVF